MITEVVNPIIIFGSSKPKLKNWGRERTAVVKSSHFAENNLLTMIHIMQKNCAGLRRPGA
jgi:hypothetical protein